MDTILYSVNNSFEQRIKHLFSGDDPLQSCKIETTDDNISLLPSTDSVSINRDICGVTLPDDDSYALIVKPRFDGGFRHRVISFLEPNGNATNHGWSYETLNDTLEFTNWKYSVDVLRFGNTLATAGDVEVTNGDLTMPGNKSIFCNNFLTDAGGFETIEVRPANGLLGINTTPGIGGLSMWVEGGIRLVDESIELPNSDGGAKSAFDHYEEFTTSGALSVTTVGLAVDRVSFVRCGNMVTMSLRDFPAGSKIGDGAIRVDIGGGAGLMDARFRPLHAVSYPIIETVLPTPVNRIQINTDGTVDIFADFNGSDFSNGQGFSFPNQTFTWNINA
jgi:hypothetical protein